MFVKVLICGENKESVCVFVNDVELGGLCLSYGLFRVFIVLEFLVLIFFGFYNIYGFGYGY